MHQRASASGTKEAHRLSRLRHALHPGEPTGRAHGFSRRSLRRLLPLPPACKSELRRPLMAKTAPTILGLSCPAPFPAKDTVLLGHGSGGKLSAELVRDIFLPAFDNPALARLDDQAVVQVNGSRIAITTDSFVVKPLFFPGGDIGSLAVHGTVNDLAMGGAQPLFLSVAFIIEEGLSVDVLRRVVRSMKEAAEAAGVRVVTGDTKVVEKGSCDNLFINTTGIGLVPEGVDLSADRARPGDKVLLSGPIAEHGIAILACREGLEFECPVESDSAALHGLVARMLDAGASTSASTNT